MRRWLLAGALLTAVACAPRANPLPGVPVPARLPAGQLPLEHRRMVFQWRYADVDMEAAGEGAARIAPPDSARLDLFLSGGLGSGRAYLVGDTVIVPGGEMLRRFLPPPPLLWAAVGRLAVPAARDTTARLAGDTLRVDIGRSPTWRVTFADGLVARLERIEGGRVVEWVSRSPAGVVRYRNESARRSLDLTITRTESVPPFDASIWGR